MNYTLNQLRIYAKIVETQSVTKASEELFLTQPAVSIQLKKFQDQFSVPLTEVVGRQLYVTDFGYEIARAAEEILNQVEAINYKTLDYQGQLAGKLKISVVSTGKYAMPYFLSRFMEQHKGIDLMMDVTNKTRVVESLENNEVDFALVSVIPEQLDIERISLMQNKLYLVAGSRLELPKRIQPQKLFEKVPLIYREQGSATRLAMEQFIASKKISTYKKLELTSNEALKQAVIAGLGCSIMPLIGIRNALQQGDLRIIPMKGLPMVTNWNLIWLKSKNLSPTALAFLEHLKAEKDEIIRQHFSWHEEAM